MNDRRISVLHLVHTMAYGGIETNVINWLTRLDRSRFEPHIVCFANPGETEDPFVRAAEQKGLAVAKIPWSRFKPFRRASAELARLIRERRASILHTHTPYADFVGFLAARRVPVTTVTTVYVWDELGWKRRALQAADRCIIRTFDLVTAHCEKTFQQTLSMGIPRDRLRTLICGFETNAAPISADERQRRRRAAGIEDDEVILLNVARLWPEKAHDLLLRCFKRVVQKYANVRLWIAGVGPSETQLKAYARELGLADTVKFVGFVDDLNSLLALVDIQVDPAKTAGVSLAVCHGLAMGVPVVAADVGSLSEVIKHAHTGFLVPRDRESGYVDAISLLSEDPGLRRRIGSAAKRFIENEYSLKSAVRRVEETYTDLLAADASSPAFRTP